MHIGSGIFAALALAALGLAGCGDGGVSSAKASDGAQSDVTVVATGCAKAPKPDCVTLTADGKTWDVTGAGVDLKRGVAVNVTGTPAGQGACGPKLAQAQVEYTGLQCPKS